MGTAAGDPDLTSSRPLSDFAGQKPTTRHGISGQRRGASSGALSTETAGAAWGEHGRGARGELDPIELAEAEAWLATAAARELGVSADVTALVAASQAALAREAEADAGRRAGSRAGPVRG